jgi:hypothetical protein
MSLSTPDLFSGLWNVEEATLPDGSFAYQGRITVQQAGDTHTVMWDTSAGRYVGIGLRYEGRLYVSCGEHFASLGIGLLKPDEAHGGFNLTWSSIELNGQLGSGRLAPSDESSGVEGVFQLIQRLPGGKLYGEWALVIQRVGDLYRLDWHRSRALHMRGFGLPTSAGIAIGWYADLAQLAFLDYVPEGLSALNAKWALGGFETLGSERLTRV